MKDLKMFSNRCIVLSVMGMMLICSQSVIGGEKDVVKSSAVLLKKLLSAEKILSGTESIDFQIINFTRLEGGRLISYTSTTDNAVKLFI